MVLAIKFYSTEDMDKFINNFHNFNSSIVKSVDTKIKDLFIKIDMIDSVEQNKMIVNEIKQFFRDINCKYLMTFEG